MNTALLLQTPVSLPAVTPANDNCVTADFEVAFAQYMVACQAMVTAAQERSFPNTPDYLKTTLGFERGRKNIRVFKQDGRSVSLSAWAFVEIETGRVFKPESWKRPAKHARGSIFNPNPLDGMGQWGPASLR